MRDRFIGFSFVVALGSAACSAATSGGVTTSSDGGGGAVIAENCPERCAAAADRCGGADQAFCDDVCSKYSEPELLCMEAAGCNAAKIAACTAKSDDAGVPDTRVVADTNPPPAPKETSCSPYARQLESGYVCAKLCRQTTINGRDYCVERCGSDSDCGFGTRCAVGTSNPFCAKTCESNATCKIYGFTTCATGFGADASEGLCTY